MNLNLLIAATLVAASSFSCAATPAPPPTPEQEAAVSEATPEMKAVLDAHAKLGPKPIATLSPTEARQQPSATDAVMQLMQDKGMSTAPMPVGDVKERSISPDGRQITVRVYTPKGDGPFPAIVYARGGGWVIATLDTYDASCRALTDMTGAVVVSVDYRIAPEHKFPAAHEDVYAVTQWVMENAGEIDADPARVAIAGESAGGNMAASVCLMAKDRNGKMPVHQLLVYPVAGGMNTPSQQKYAQARPLSTDMLPWFLGHYTNGPADMNNKYFALLKATTADLTGLPPATVITAQIDPLLNEGQQYADMLKAAGVDVAYRNFDGVTHEFFGMAAVVPTAKEAQQFAAERLKAPLMR